MSRATIPAIPLRECGHDALEALGLIPGRLLVLEQTFGLAAAADGDAPFVPDKNAAGFWFALEDQVKAIRLLIEAAESALVAEANARHAEGGAQ